MKRVVLGTHAVQEAVRAKPAAIVVVYVEAGARRALKALDDEARARGVRVEERDRAELDALAKGGKHQGVLAITGDFQYVELEDALAAAPERPLVVALDEVTDPHNFGAIVRSAVALGADLVVTLKDRAAPVTPVVVRASAGATEHAKIARVTNLSRALTTLRDGCSMQVVGLAADGDCSIDALPDAPNGRVLVVGSEGSGLRPLVRKQCELVASIPLVGPVSSLNASVAAGIALHAAARQR